MKPDCSRSKRDTEHEQGSPRVAGINAKVDRRPDAEELRRPAPVAAGMCQHCEDMAPLGGVERIGRKLGTRRERIA